MHTPTIYGDTLWRNAHGAFVVSPIAPSSLKAHAAQKPAAKGMSAVGIRHAAAATVASVRRGHI